MSSEEYTQDESGTVDPINRTFGRNIKRLREAHGKSQLETAEATGFAQAYISRIENGRIGPSTETIRRFSTLFKITPDELFMAAPDPNSPSEGPELPDNPFVFLKSIESYQKKRASMEARIMEGLNGERLSDALSHKTFYDGKITSLILAFNAMMRKRRESDDTDLLPQDREEITSMLRKLSPDDLLRAQAFISNLHSFDSKYVGLSPAKAKQVREEGEREIKELIEKRGRLSPFLDILSTLDDDELAPLQTYLESLKKKAVPNPSEPVKGVRTKKSSS